jgi:hypothetical protein
VEELIPMMRSRVLRRPQMWQMAADMGTLGLFGITLLATTGGSCGIGQYLVALMAATYAILGWSVFSVPKKGSVAYVRESGSWRFEFSEDGVGLESRYG